MRVLITGGDGQLGRELGRADWAPDVETWAFSSSDLDITDPEAVATATINVGPDVVVNAAAYTAVDSAEQDEVAATAVNGTAVGYLAKAANELGALLVHVSTDYVFDGTKDGWYVEGDEPNPVSAYGRSKLAGERAALNAQRSVVLRTSWVYGALGSNFVTTMRRLGAERDELSVVADQHGCPTSAADLAAAIVQLVNVTNGGEQLPGRLYHVAAPDEATWHDVAVETLSLSTVDFAGECRPIPTSDYPTPARRPANSRLDTTAIRADLGIELPPWRDSLARVVTELDSHALKPAR
jgi:dTDP-4-dehydrorhamnose reductase